MTLTLTMALTLTMKMTMKLKMKMKMKMKMTMTAMIYFTTMNYMKYLYFEQSMFMIYGVQYESSQIP